MKRTKAKFKVGQVVYLSYCGQYRRIVRLNKFSACVGTFRENVPVIFRLLRPLTQRERGPRRSKP